MSVIELYILNYLIRVAGSVVRFKVYNEVHGELGFETMSRSSFYNSLKKLSDDGFVIIEGGTKADGKTKAVKATDLAREAIEQVNIFNLWGSIHPDSKIKNFIKSSHLFQGEKSLVISFQTPANQEITAMLSASDAYLLGNEENNGPIAEDYQLVSIDGTYFDKRENFFDFTVIYRYAYNSVPVEIKFEDLVRESIRVTRPGGRVIFLGLAQLQGTNNLMLESGIGRIMEKSLSNQRPDQVVELLKQLDTEKISNVEHQEWEELSVIIVDM